MARRINKILGNYREFLFRAVLSKLNEGESLLVLNKHTEEEDLYRFIIKQGDKILKYVPIEAMRSFIEILEHLIDYYEDDQEYEKCQILYDLIKKWENIENLK
tara:strand:- start:124 stop:432 length:309 start_codon:yes stop_codon:yes gene_type:complete